MQDSTLKSCREFVSLLASSAPTPGGGGAAALAGALGMALGNMVGSLTVGKKKYAEVEGEIIRLNERASKLENELLDMVRRDAEGFEPLAKAYLLSKDEPNRDVILEEATMRACEAPMEIMEKCAKVIDLIERYSQIGSRLAISDAGCAAALALAALRAASMNVFINTSSLKDKDKASKIEARADELLDEYMAKARRIEEEVMQTIRK